jgi:hypothetical protein
MNLEIVELGLIGDETKGNPLPSSEVEEIVKGFNRTEADDDAP